MYKGTTPTFTLTLPEEIDLLQADSVYVTLTTDRRKLLLEKTQDDGLTITANAIDVFLTQQETLAMPTGTVLLQVNWTYQEAGVAKRACSDVVRISWENNLHGEVIS